MRQYFGILVVSLIFELSLIGLILVLIRSNVGQHTLQGLIVMLP